MDIKAVTQILQMYMMKNINSDDTDTSDNQSADMFNVLLQQMLNEAVNDGSGENVLQDNFNNTENIDSDNTINLDKNINGTIESAIEQSAQKYGLDENFIKAIVGQESNFHPDSVSKAGAMGLMQLMPKTAESLGVKNPLDILENIDGGTRYIKKLIDSFGGNKELALAAYNGGISRMNNRGVDTTEEINKMPTETQNYVEKVMKKYEGYKKI